MRNEYYAKPPGIFGWLGRMVCLALVSLIVSHWAAALDVPIVYQKYAEMKGGYLPYGNIALEKMTKAPPGDWVLPKLISEVPIYCLYKLGGRECLLILDKQDKTGDFYDRIYFDANGDRNLTNDPWVDANVARAQQRNYAMANFPSIDTTVMVAGQSLPYCFRPHIYCFFNDPDKPVTDKNNWINFNVNSNVQCAYEGIVRYKGKSYTILLNDRNANGLFGDSLKIRDIKRASSSTPQVLYGQGDVAFIKSGEEKMSFYSGLYMGQYLVLGDTLFSVQVKIAESKITLTPVTENLVSVALPAGVDRLLLHDEGGKQNIMMYHPGATVKLPAGKYRPYSYTLDAKDEQKDGWRLVATATTATPGVSVTAGRENRITFGEPFTPVVEIQDWSKQNFIKGHAKSVTLGFSVRGTAGEQVTYLGHVSGLKTKIKLSQSSQSYPAEPVYRIITSEGELVGDGSFEYG